MSRPLVKVLILALNFSFLIHEFCLKVLMSYFPFMQTVRFYFMLYLIRRQISDILIKPMSGLNNFKIYIN